MLSDYNGSGPTHKRATVRADRHAVQSSRTPRSEPAEPEGALQRARSRVSRHRASGGSGCPDPDDHGGRFSRLPRVERAGEGRHVVSDDAGLEPGRRRIRYRGGHCRHDPDRARRGDIRRAACARRGPVSLIELMAAVPSVVFGLWGAFFLQWRVISLSRWINAWFYWIPLFKVTGIRRHDPLATPTAYTSSTFIAGLVVALMITPIACSIMREAFSQAPIGEREGAYALGATRWGMIRSVVLPFGRGAMIGGIMLGLGRALGETIAVVMIISPIFKIQLHVLEKGTSSVSSLIALRYSESTPFAVSALMAAGLALFALTLVVNFAAAVIVSRSRSGAVSEA